MFSFNYAFARPSVTATVGLVTPDHRFLCGLRGRKDGAYAGFYCIPGGFLDAKISLKDIIVGSASFSIFAKNLFNYVFRQKKLKAMMKELVRTGERIEDTAIREIREETGLHITEDRLQLVSVKSDPETDPRAHVVNICFYVILTEAELVEAEAGDDLESLRIMTYDEISQTDLAFNHNEIINDIWSKL